MRFVAPSTGSLAVFLKILASSLQQKTGVGQALGDQELCGLGHLHPQPIHGLGTVTTRVAANDGRGEQGFCLGHESVILRRRDIGVAQQAHPLDAQLLRLRSTGQIGLETKVDIGFVIEGEVDAVGVVAVADSRHRIKRQRLLLNVLCGAGLA